MPTPQDATEYILAELTRRLNEVASRLEVGMNRMDGIYVRRDVYDQWLATAKQEHVTLSAVADAASTAVKTTTNELERRLKDIEEGKQWLLRLCLGTLATGIVSILLTVLYTTKGK